VLKQIRPALVIFGLLTLITGIVYPLAVTGIAQLVFPKQANGSIIMQNNEPVGSALIGQWFSDPKYFWGRPSSSTPYPYNPLGSTGSNEGPLNPAWLQSVQGKVKALRAAEPENTLLIPVDLVTASGSGLDPQISVAAARYQASRIARLRGLDLNTVMGLIDQYTANRWLGFLGEPVVNVLELNLALERLQ
jgi:K+-transporting ATPase ATPase C chain